LIEAYDPLVESGTDKFIAVTLQPSATQNHGFW